MKVKPITEIGKSIGGFLGYLRIITGEVSNKNYSYKKGKSILVMADSKLKNLSQVHKEAFGAFVSKSIIEAKVCSRMFIYFHS